MVPAPENTKALQIATKRGGNDDVTIVTFPRMNHLLQLNDLTPAERARDDSIAAEVLDKLEAWVADKMRPAAESR